MSKTKIIYEPIDPSSIEENGDDDAASSVLSEEETDDQTRDSKEPDVKKESDIKTEEQTPEIEAPLEEQPDPINFFDLDLDTKVHVLYILCEVGDCRIQMYHVVMQFFLANSRSLIVATRRSRKNERTSSKRGRRSPLGKKCCYGKPHFCQPCSIMISRELIQSDTMQMEIRIGSLMVCYLFSNSIFFML